MQEIYRKFLTPSPRDEVQSNPYSSSILAAITNLIFLRKAVATENLISGSVTFVVGFPRSNCSSFGKWSQDREYPDRYLVRSAKLPYHLNFLLD